MQFLHNKVLLVSRNVTLVYWELFSMVIKGKLYSADNFNTLFMYMMEALSNTCMINTLSVYSIHMSN